MAQDGIERSVARSGWIRVQRLFEAEFPGQDIALIAGPIGWVRFAATRHSGLGAFLKVCNDWQGILLSQGYSVELPLPDGQVRKWLETR